MDRHNTMSITTSLSPLTVYCAAKLTSSIFTPPPVALSRWVMHGTISMTRAARCVTPNGDAPPGLTDEKRKEAVRSVAPPGDNGPLPLLLLMAPQAAPARLPASRPTAASSRAVRLHQARVCTCVEYRSSETTSSFALSPLGAAPICQNGPRGGAFISLFVF